MILFLNGDTFLLGFLYYRKSKVVYLFNEPIPKDSNIQTYQIIGLVLCFIDFLIISSEKFSGKLLYKYYLNHRFSIILLYFVGFLVYAGTFSVMIIIKRHHKRTNFNEISLR